MTPQLQDHDPVRLAANLWKLNAIRGLFWTHFISSVLIPFYRDWGGLTLQQILAVNAWFMVWNFLLEIPTGTIADVWGRRASLVLGCVLGVFAAILYISAPSLPRFLIAEILFAASFTLMSGADEALLYETLGLLGRTAEAPRRFTRLASFQQVGIVIGALLGSVILYALGPRAPLGLQTVPMALAALIALSLLEPHRHQAGTKRPSYRSVMTVGVRTFLGSPPLRRLTLHLTVFSAVAWMIIWLYQPLIERAGIPLIAFGAVHTLMSLAQIVVLARTEWLEHVLGSRRRLLLLGPVATLAGFAALVGLRSPMPAVVLIVLIAGFGLSRPPLFSAHLNHHIDAPSHRATVLSTVAMFRTLTVAGGNLLVGLMTRVSLDVTLVGLAVASAVLLALPLRSDDLDLSRVDLGAGELVASDLGADDPGGVD